MQQFLSVAAVLVCAVFSLSTHACLGAGPTNLITNGSFELPAVNGINQEFVDPSTAIPGWRVSFGSIDLVTSGSILGNAHSGLQMIDINGSGAGVIQQSFATVPGNRYQLELYYSNNPNPSFALPSYSASIQLSGVSQLMSAVVTHAGATESDMNWVKFTRSFTADSAIATLALSSAHGGFNGIYFDSVSVVPEPTLAAMIAPMGLAVACITSRLRRPQG